MVERARKLKLARLFISHASEDKDSFVRPLADALVIAGFEVWFDEYSLVLGDSLKANIDLALSDCDFGIVVLSPSFFAKRWPKEELDGLSAIENARNKKVILPIWHELSFEEIARYSPTLAGKLAVRSSVGIDKVVSSIRRSVNHAIFYTSREDLERYNVYVPTVVCDINMNILKLPETSWEDFGRQLLKELRRLDKKQKLKAGTPNKTL